MHNLNCVNPAINFSDWFAKLSERDPQARRSISTREVRPPTNHHDAQLWLNAPSDAPNASPKKSLSAQAPNVGRGKARAESHQISHSTEHVVGGGLYKKISLV